MSAATGRTARELAAALLQNADTTEKSVEFIDDEEMRDEAAADITLWREAAGMLVMLGRGDE